jgi:predicted NBD/HSP70 family sugar kinase
VRELGVLASELLEEAGVDSDGAALLHTVVGSPGIVEPGGRALQLAPNLPGWERPAVLRDLRRLLGSEATIENDVDSAAVAERDHGQGREFSTFAFVSVGTGIGMGLILGGELHRGAHGAVGEIAFLPLADDSLESAASAAASVGRPALRRRCKPGSRSSRRSSPRCGRAPSAKTRWSTAASRSAATSSGIAS